MSSRQLRKLQQQRELEQAKLRAEAEAEADGSEASDDEPIIQSIKPKPSLFANFAALEDQDEDEDGDEEKGVDNEANQDEETSADEPALVIVKKAKKPKKKKKKVNNKGKEIVEEKPENGEDEIDAALEALRLQNQNSDKAEETPAKSQPEFERVCTLLGISTQHLKVANEMRNLFGRTATDNHDDAGGPVGRGARRRGRGQQPVDLETALKGRHAPGKGLSELTLRRNILIQGKDDWPKATTGGLTMAVVDDQQVKDGTIEFKYSHDKSYQEVQLRFNRFVEMGDPQKLIELLSQNPYHLSLLIQVSKIAKDQTDHALSSDLLERALFTLGRAATSVFNTKLSQGKARLDFARPENREIWLAGYQYIKSLVMKGTYRTAFEWAKLLLSLDPEDDPYCMRFMLHHLAIRCRQFQWLLEFADSGIAKLWSPKNPELSPALLHTSPSLAFAAMQLKDEAKARKLLEESMQKVPWLFCRLLQELNLDVPPSIWGIVGRTDAEQLFSEIYVLQTKDLWNTSEATFLLLEIAHAIPKVDTLKIPRVDNTEMTLDVVRFVYLDNTPALMALAPSRLLHQSNNSDSDPLPPAKNIYSYELQKEVLEGHGGMPNPEDGFHDPLEAIRRLLPGFANLGFGGAEHDDGPPDFDQLRRDYEEMMRNRARVSGEGGGENANDEVEARGPSAPGVLSRLMGFLLGSSPIYIEGTDTEEDETDWRYEDDDDDDDDEDDEDEDDEDEDDDDSEDEDDDSEGMPDLIDNSDDEMPGLGSGNDSDDEMPDLVESLD